MAFRSTNLNLRDIFYVHSAPGNALANAVDRIAGGIADVVEKKRQADEDAREEADAIGLFHAAKSGDINNLFAAIKDKDNADLALNLGKVLMTKNQIDYNRQMQDLDARRRARMREFDEQAAEFAGPQLLKAIQEKIIIPGIDKEGWMPKRDASGQVILGPDKKPMYEWSVIPGDDIVVDNPAYGMAQDLLRQLDDGNRKMTPELLDQIIKTAQAGEENATKRALAAERLRRSNEVSSRIGDRGIVKSGESAQDAEESIARDDRQHEYRISEIDRAASYRQQEIEQRATAASNLLDRKLEAASTAAEKAQVYRTELERVKYHFRQKLEAADTEESKRKELASVRKWKIQEINRVKKPDEDLLGDPVPGTGLTDFQSHWHILRSDTPAELANFAESLGNESAMLVMMFKLFVGTKLSTATLGTPTQMKQLQLQDGRTMGQFIEQMNKNGYDITDKKLKQFAEEIIKYENDVNAR